MKILIPPYLWLAALLLSMAGIPAIAKQKIKIWVKETRGPGDGQTPMQCLQIKYDIKDTAWQNYYGTIEGFNYETGSRYQLLVDVVPVDNPPPEAPPFKYKLQRIISQRRISFNNSEIWEFISRYNWKLMQLENTPFTNSSIHLVFDKKDQLFTGSAGCNRISGSFITVGAMVRFSNAAITTMACDDADAIRMEDKLAQVMSGQEFSFDVADKRLSFLDREGKVIMIFQISGAAIENDE